MVSVAGSFFSRLAWLSQRMDLNGSEVTGIPESPLWGECDQWLTELKSIFLPGEIQDMCNVSHTKLHFPFAFLWIYVAILPAGQVLFSL